ncbi:MAG: thiamine-phosphate kinase [Bacteroidales bacterium]
MSEFSSSSSPFQRDRFLSELRSKAPLLNATTLFGIGDDAAVVRYGSNLQLLTTDTLIEGIHFDLTYVPVKHLGYKAAVVNFSDVYAMNGHPKQLMVSLALSAKISSEWLNTFYEGVLAACGEHGVDLVGGDLTPSLTGFCINMSVVGEVDKAGLVYRSGMKEGDLLCVTGDLGAAYLGLQVLEREKRLFEKDSSFTPALEGYDYVIKRQLKPSARKDIIDYFAAEKLIPTAMTDLSAGLAHAIQALCLASGVGCRLYEHKIPIAGESLRVASELHQSPQVAALHGGQDYELLFSVPPDRYEPLLRQGDISILGHAVAEKEGITLFAESGEQVSL